MSLENADFTFEISSDQALFGNDLSIVGSSIFSQSESSSDATSIKTASADFSITLGTASVSGSDIINFCRQFSVAYVDIAVVGTHVDLPAIRAVRCGLRNYCMSLNLSPSSAVVLIAPAQTVSMRDILATLPA